MESLPLFPLGTVLLPGMSLPLQIFEPRYVALMSHLARGDWPSFGVVAIRRGHEVGARLPELYPVGCAATLESTHREDHRLVVETLGRRRFRIESVHTERAPYLIADVRWLDKAAGGDENPSGSDGPDGIDGEPDLAGRVEEAQRAFTGFARTVGAAVDGLPDDPALLSASILDGLGQPLPEHQAVLEAGGVADRLRAVARLAQREEALVRALRCRTARVTPPMDLNPN